MKDNNSSNGDFANGREGRDDSFDVFGFAATPFDPENLKEVVVDGYQVIGHGFACTVYKIDSTLAIKVYSESVPFETVFAEYDASKKAFAAGVSTIKVFDVVRVGNTYATVIELIDGITLGKAFTDYPEKFEELVDLYAGLFKKLTEIEVPSGSLPCVTQILNNFADRMALFLKEEDIRMLKEIISYFPQADFFIHEDLHPGNIMYRNGELILIDNSQCSVGPKNFDLFCLYRNMLFPLQNKEHLSLVENTLGMSGALIQKVWDALLERFFGTLSRGEIEKKIEEMALGIMPAIILRAACQPDEHIRAILPGWQKIIDDVIWPNKDRIIEIVKQM